MAIYELWLEQNPDGSYIAGFDRIPPEKKDSSYITPPFQVRQQAVFELRNRLRGFLGPSDQLRIRQRSRIYENINEALEDLLRK